MFTRRKSLLKLSLCTLYVIGILVIVKQLFHANDNLRIYKARIDKKNFSQRQKDVDFALQGLQNKQYEYITYYFIYLIPVYLNGLFIHSFIQYHVFYFYK